MTFLYEQYYTNYQHLMFAPAAFILSIKKVDKKAIALSVE